MFCALSVDQNTPQYVYDTDDPQWFDNYEGMSGWMNFYEHYGTPFNPIVKSVEGGVGQVFSDIYNPPLYSYLDAGTTYDSSYRSALTAWYST
jgi:hypothetical protein